MSFDLISDGEYVTEADICERLPLPGKSDGGGRIVDVAVCALSLMSLNWMGCLKEARRVLTDTYVILYCIRRLSFTESYISFTGVNSRSPR